MARKRTMAALVLILWVLLGPVAMAFDGCLLMGTLCDGGPCANASSVAYIPAPVIGPGPSGPLAAAPRLPIRATTLPPLDPPPKSPLLAA